VVARGAAFNEAGHKMNIFRRRVVADTKADQDAARRTLELNRARADRLRSEAAIITIRIPGKKRGGASQ
jgi:hypothetical protein